MKKTNRQMSLLEYDIIMSKKHRLEEYANMSKEEKDKFQEGYISGLIQSICDRVRKGEARGRASIAVQPKQIYPFDKMLEDIKERLKKDNIKVKNVVIVTNSVSHCIVACRFEWVKIELNFI